MNSDFKSLPASPIDLNASPIVSLRLENTVPIIRILDNWIDSEYDFPNNKGITNGEIIIIKNATSKLISELILDVWLKNWNLWSLFLILDKCGKIILDTAFVRGRWAVLHDSAIIYNPISFDVKR